MQAATLQRRQLDFHQRAAAPARSRGGQHHAAGRLARVGAVEHLLAGQQQRRAVKHHRPALERAAVLAAGHHLLARVAAFLKIDPAHQIQVDHLRHKSVHRGSADAGHAAVHFQPCPVVGRQRGQVWCRQGGRLGQQIARRVTVAWGAHGALGTWDSIGVRQADSPP